MPRPGRAVRSRTRSGGFQTRPVACNRRHDRAGSAAIMECHGMPNAPSTGSRAAWIVEIALIAALYVGGAHLRLFFPFTEVGASWVWIPSGISLAALLLRGADRWPGVAVGAFLSGAFTDWHWPSATVAAAYAAGEALLATKLLQLGRPLRSDAAERRHRAEVRGQRDAVGCGHGGCRRLEPDLRCRPGAGAASARRGSPSGWATPWRCSP